MADDARTDEENADRGRALRALVTVAILGNASARAFLVTAARSGERWARETVRRVAWADGGWALDAILVAAVEGDGWAMEAILLTVTPRIMPVIRKKLRGQQGAMEDVAQTTGKAILTKLGSIRDCNALISWACRIAYCRAIDWLRSARSTTRLDSVDELGPDSNPEGRLEARDRLRALMRATEKLSPKPREALEALIQRFFDGDAAEPEPRGGAERQALLRARKELGTALGLEDPRPTVPRPTSPSAGDVSSARWRRADDGAWRPASVERRRNRITFVLHGFSVVQINPTVRRRSDSCIVPGVGRAQVSVEERQGASGERSYALGVRYHNDDRANLLLEEVATPVMASPRQAGRVNASWTGAILRRGGMWRYIDERRAVVIHEATRSTVRTPFWRGAVDWADGAATGRLWSDAQTREAVLEARALGDGQYSFIVRMDGECVAYGLLTEARPGDSSGKSNGDDASAKG